MESTLRDEIVSRCDRGYRLASMHCGNVGKESEFGSCVTMRRGEEDQSRRYCKGGDEVISGLCER